VSYLFYKCFVMYIHKYIMMYKYKSIVSIYYNRIVRCGYKFMVSDKFQLIQQALESRAPLFSEALEERPTRDQPVIS
jgi:hypothetical protein